MWRRPAHTDLIYKPRPKHDSNQSVFQLRLPVWQGLNMAENLLYMYNTGRPAGRCDFPKLDGGRHRFSDRSGRYGQRSCRHRHGLQEGTGVVTRQVNDGPVSKYSSRLPGIVGKIKAVVHIVFFLGYHKWPGWGLLLRLWNVVSYRGIECPLTDGGASNVAPNLFVTRLC